MTNVELVAGDLIFVALNCEEGISKLFTVDTATEETGLVIDEDDYSSSFDMDRVPSAEGTGNYFILHQGNGLHLVDPQHKRMYTLSHSRNDAMNTCRSLALTLIDEKDPSLGFWLAWIDNSQNFSTEVKIYNFDTKFMAEMGKLSEKTKIMTILENPNTVGK